jgi:hypothetical protein
VSTAYYESFHLHQTVHVSGHGDVTYDVSAPHEGANLQCSMPIGESRDPVNGVMYTLRCKKRAGHPTPKDEQPHVAVDTRIIAAPVRVAHGFRFAPGGIPAGVDQTVTTPHDCANHLQDVEEVARGYR